MGPDPPNVRSGPAMPGRFSVAARFDGATLGVAPFKAVAVLDEPSVMLAA